MKNDEDKLKASALLRKQAEERLKKLSETDYNLSETDTLKLIHELQVHKIELEMQNEELKEHRDHLKELVREKTAQLEEKNLLLESTLANIKTLKTLLPICSNCKKIRDDKGYWEQVDTYIASHTDTRFSHALCPDCLKELYTDIADEVLNEAAQLNKAKKKLK